jgi:hypothetical protein
VRTIQFPCHSSLFWIDQHRFFPMRRGRGVGEQLDLARTLECDIKVNRRFDGL